MQAAAEIARAAARSWLSPLLDTACDRLAFVLGNLFDLALERNQNHDSECKNHFFLSFLQIIAANLLHSRQSIFFNCL